MTMRVRLWWKTGTTNDPKMLQRSALKRYAIIILVSCIKEPTLRKSYHNTKRKKKKRKKRCREKKNVIVLHETILSKVDEIVAQGQAFLKIGLSYVRTNVSNSLHTLFPYSYQRQGIFASEFCTLFFSIGTDVLNSLIYLVRGKFQRQKIPVPRLGAI